MANRLTLLISFPPSFPSFLPSFPLPCDFCAWQCDQLTDSGVSRRLPHLQKLQVGLSTFQITADTYFDKHHDDALIAATYPVTILRSLALTCTSLPTCLLLGLRIYANVEVSLLWNDSVFLIIRC